MKTEDQKDIEATRWNHRPTGPVALNPMFDWPPKFFAIMRWYSAYWLAASTTTLALVLAIAAYFTILPSLEAMQKPQLGWITRVWIANLVPHTICAGVLHLWLYKFKGQDKDFKYDPRQPATNNGIFSFRNQVHDNMFWTLISGVSQWSIMQCLVFWAMANGYAPAFLFPDNIIWFFLMFPFLILWASFHFYWVHRLLHFPFLYKRYHALHHRNINIGPWSGLSMHPVEHLLYLSSFCIHWIIATHPIHLIFHVIWQGPAAAMTHSGYEDLLIKDKRRLALGTFYHQLHHRYFECNYGNQEMPWDRWFGTFHDGSERSTEETRARKKNMY